MSVAVAIEPARAVPARMIPTRYRLESPPTGETFELVSSARTSADRKFRFVWSLAPGKRGPGEHYHDPETEVFAIVSGVLRMWLDGVPGDHGPGDVVTVKPGVRHRFLNPGKEPVVVNVTIDGTKMEDGFVPIAVATHGRKPRLREILSMFVGFETYMPSIPASKGEMLFIGGFVSLLKLFGLRAFPRVHGWDVEAN